MAFVVLVACLPVAIGVAHCVEKREVGLAVSGAERRVGGEEDASLQAGVPGGGVDSTDHYVRADSGGTLCDCRKALRRRQGGLFSQALAEMGRRGTSLRVLHLHGLRLLHRLGLIQFFVGGRESNDNDARHGLLQCELKIRERQARGPCTNCKIMHVEVEVFVGESGTQKVYPAEARWG